jgi:glycosyltransferase involved in cell wall biosynthesis
MRALSDLTIVVPTRNEAANIGTFLASVPPEAELIVVDNSDDDTVEIVRRRPSYRTLVLHCAESLTVAREKGARAARSRWLLFADADVRFAAGYFATLSELLDRPGVGALLFGPKLSADDYAGHYRRLSIAQGVLARLRIPAASGSNMLVSSEAFAAVGGFDTSLSCNEDSELGWRIARAGFSWAYEPSLVVFATDHRRLRRGPLRKTLHTVLRCSSLYLDLIPRRWRSHDWGYWRAARRTTR